MVASKKQETHRRSAVIVTLRQALKRSGSGDAALRESIRVAASVVLRDLAAVNKDVEEVAFEAPWLTEGVARLAGMSDALRVSAVEIQAQAASIELPALRELCSTFLDQCRDHEALRHALIQAAYSSDEQGLGERAEAGP